MKRKTSKLSEIPKSESQYVHAKKRAKEHFNLDLTKKLYRDIIQAVMTGNVEGIKTEYKYQQSDRVHIYWIHLISLDIKMEVVFDRHRNTISTVMPERDGRFFPHYFDRFGNKINVFEEFNCSAIHLDDEGNPKNFNNNLVRLGSNLYKFITENLHLELVDGDFVEVLM